MRSPVPFVAVASPDGTGWGLAIGKAQALDPGLEWELAERIAPLLDTPPVGLEAVTLGEGYALRGTLPDPRDGDSVRLAMALFEDGRVFGLSALRPRRARGHDRDAIDAVVHEEGGSRPVDDPRLSVTLNGDGVPQRVGLELWLAPAEEEGYDFPRRAAGEVLGPGLELEAGPLQATAHRVRWRSRAEDGGGWFVVLRAR